MTHPEEATREEFLASVDKAGYKRPDRERIDVNTDSLPAGILCGGGEPPNWSKEVAMRRPEAIALIVMGLYVPAIPALPGPAAKIDKMVDVGGRKLDCCVYGDGSPTVVLVSGLEAPQAYWDSVIPDLAARATVVTYDRAGVGKSEIGDLPTHGEQSAKDLQVLLEIMSVPKPYILVGHSYGGNIARLFASMFPDDTGGLILEDTQHEEVLNEMRKILEGKDLEAFDELMAARFNTPERPKTEADYREMTREQIRKSKPLPRIPYVVLMAAGRAKAMAPLFSDKAIEKMAKMDSELNDRLVALIPGGRQVVVEGTGHDIHVDKPEVIIALVMEMIKVARTGPGSGSAQFLQAK